MLFYITLCFSSFFPIIGACCAQIKDFTLGLTRTSSRQPNVKPFICAQHAPKIGKTYKNTNGEYPNFELSRQFTMRLAHNS